MIKRGLALLVLLCMALPCAGMAEQTEARRVVYLTFDDGPKKDTPELLETLSELDVPATFFLVGLSVRAFPEYAKQIHADYYGRDAMETVRIAEGIFGYTT